MPKIGGWSRADNIGPLDSNPVWQHDETDVTVYVSHKVPDDGYYVMRVDEEDGYIGMGDGERIGYDHRKDVAMSIARKRLKENPEGFNKENE